MNINTTDLYEELASEWQFQMIHMLKEVLSKHKIPLDIAKEICGDFAFDISMLQDQGEVNVDGMEFRPVICFESFEGELHYNSDDQFQLHDHAYGNCNEIFEAN